MKDFDEQTTFLVVDDDPQVLQTVTEYLESFGASNILTASSGKEAISVLEANSIGFVISDWEMAEMSGVELRRMLQADVRWKNIHFVIMTSPTSRENLKIREAGLSEVDAYLIKPFRSALLKHRIEDVMWKRRLELRKAAMVVDDDESVRSTVKGILQSMDFNPIHEAGDGDKAFQILQSFHQEIAIVISDWEMPHTSGIDLLRNMRNDQTLSIMPFIMVTSQESSERDKLKRAIEADVDQYLMKPFRADDLRAKVKTVLKNWTVFTETQRNMDRADEFVSARSLVEAEQLYKKVLVLDPKCIDAYLKLAKCTMLSKPSELAPEAAIALIKKAIKCDPKVDVGYLAMAELLEAQLALEETVSLLKKGIAQCPLSANLHYQLGRIFFRQGRAEDGERELKQALELNPDLQEAKDLLMEV